MRISLAILLAALLASPTRAVSAPGESSSRPSEAQKSEAPVSGTTASDGPESETGRQEARDRAPGNEPEGASPSGPDGPVVGQGRVIRDRVTVTATRLRDEPEPSEWVPAHASVLFAEEIESSGALTLQDLLSLQSGVVLYDQVGNDVSKTLDLRGFSGGNGTRVFLDGVPLNQLRNNGLSLELVSLPMLERVEVVRGSTGTLAGGGSQAGVVNLFTRRAGGLDRPLAGGAWLAAGDNATTRYGAELGARRGRADLLVLGSWHDTEGFRENADANLRQISGTFGFELGERDGPDRRLSLMLIEGRADLGAPGSLTPAELRADPTRSPFNSLDGSDESYGLASLNFRGALAGSGRLSANLFYRDRGAEILTTGRSAPVFGGFFTDAGSDAWGTVAQVTHHLELGRGSNDLGFGLEWLDGDTEARGWFTPPGDPGSVDSSALSSANSAGRQTAALFVQDTWRPSGRWSFTAGLRWDRDRFEYTEAAPDSANRAERDFEDLSFRAGLNWSVGGGATLFAAYGQAFLPPTVEQLFSFPLFGSNPALEPEDSSSFELGAIWRLARGRNVDVTLFRVETSDEIVFDPDSPLGLFGANVNAGKTRRTGLEADFVGPILGGSGLGLDLFSHLTLVEAEFSNGPNQGKTVPLVPGQRLSLGLEGALPAGLGFRLEGLWVGEQVLDSDEANEQPKLDAYAVVNARVSWNVGEVLGGGWGSAWDGLRLFVEARNLLDGAYATRGIYAFDFSTFRNEIFLTPAPDRRLLAGLRWRL